jgi:hypothetical protein
MPRKVRVQFPGAVFRVTSRGDQRDDIFFDDGNRYDVMCPATARSRADRLAAEELQRLEWSAQDLARRAKKDPGKLAIAARLRRETTLTIMAIAARVQLGTCNTANARLHRAMKEEVAPPDRAQATLWK